MSCHTSSTRSAARAANTSLCAIAGPSVRYALCRIVVEDSVSLLFSEGHFPTIDCGDRDVRAALADIVKETRLNLTMTEAAIRGSIGSVAVLMRVLRGRVFFDVLDTTYLTPEWDPEEPDTLTCVTEKYKVAGRPARIQRLRHSRPRGRSLVHAKLGHRERNLVRAGSGRQYICRRKSTRRAA